MDDLTRGNDERPTSLSSAEYRSKLLTKLNCLIAVLEVAIAKISRSMDLPGANEERLLRIRANLENTLSICNRAKHSLERSMASEARAHAPSESASGAKPAMTYRDYVELSSIDEYRRFKTLPPIRADELEGLDVDSLIDRLMDA